MNALKPLHFIGSSKRDLTGFPTAIRKEAGFALYLAQMGDKSVGAYPMVGFGGASVLEVVMTDDGRAFRAVYTVRFKKAIYVLHAFEKKSKKGIGTPQTDMNLIRRRLKTAEEHYVRYYEQKAKEQQKQEQKHGRAS